MRPRGWGLGRREQHFNRMTCEETVWVESNPQLLVLHPLPSSPLSATKSSLWVLNQTCQEVNRLYLGERLWQKLALKILIVDLLVPNLRKKSFPLFKFEFKTIWDVSYCLTSECSVASLWHCFYGWMTFRIWGIAHRSQLWVGSLIVISVPRVLVCVLYFRSVVMWTSPYVMLLSLLTDSLHCAFSMTTYWNPKLKAVFLPGVGNLALGRRLV